MPIETCNKDGLPGYRWGKNGACYTYAPGNNAARKVARAKAARQGRAVEASKRSKA